MSTARKEQIHGYFAYTKLVFIVVSVAVLLSERHESSERECGTFCEQ